MQPSVIFSLMKGKIITYYLQVLRVVKTGVIDEALWKLYIFYYMKPNNFLEHQEFFKHHYRQKHMLLILLHFHPYNIKFNEMKGANESRTF